VWEFSITMLDSIEKTGQKGKALFSQGALQLLFFK
jgi:hypothetical protein